MVFPQIQLSIPHTYVAKTTATVLVLLSSKIAAENFLTTPGKTSFRIWVIPYPIGKKLTYPAGDRVSSYRTLPLRKRLLSRKHFPRES